MMHTEQFETKEIALKREMQLKSWKNRQKLEELITSARPGLDGSGHPD
jgi:predicted GIY-YIG superfamily endonuclease